MTKNIIKPPTLTVKELKEKLAQYPEDMVVFLDERSTEFRYGLLNSVSSHEISFMENPEDTEPLSTDTVLILSEQ